MTFGLIVRIFASIALLALIGAAGWILMLPGAPEGIVAPAVPEAEARALVDALKPPKRARPVVAVIGINNATETTDYIMPAGILRRADVADVELLATSPGPVQLYPALRVAPDATFADFDQRYPKGADYVIVPAMEPGNHPAALAWIREQAARGAIIVGVCAGATVVGEAGLLQGRRATTHWFYLDELQRETPDAVYVADRRMVADRGVVTTTGITASIPLALTMVEAIAGRAHAEAVAQEIGLEVWDARHASAAFRFNRDFALTVIGNSAQVWARETLGLRVTPGMDEVSLALVADAWSRTYRSRVTTFAAAPFPVMTANGMRILPDEVATDWAAERLLADVGVRMPQEVLDNSLAQIAGRYGSGTSDVVAMQLEYPKP